MGLCAKCKDFFPPDIMTPADDGDKLCIFCVRDQKEIVYGDNNEYILSREETVKEYKMFLRELKESKNIARVIADKSKEEDESLVKLYK